LAVRAWHRFLADERGLETVEYAIIAGLIESSLVALIVAVGEWNLGRLKLLGRSLYGT
jgi:Flp pilus assembly pilin Flp